MASYRTEWRERAVKELRRLPTKELTRVLEAVGLLAIGAPNLDAIPLKGDAALHRLRVGDYRVFYFYIEKVLIITEVLHRKDAYR